MIDFIKKIFSKIVKIFKAIQKIEMGTRRRIVNQGSLNIKPTREEKDPDN